MKKGYKHTKESKEKIRQTLIKKGIKPPSSLGRKHSEETKRRISEALKKKNGDWCKKGWKHSEETRKKMSKSQKKNKKAEKTQFKKGQFAGEKNYCWKGGISFEPYSIDWTETLKRSIRERDNYICQICNQYGYNVHHIDYDKKNSNPPNLITLCKKCHAKTNYNRDYWINRFNN